MIDAVIVGAGLSGIGAGIELLRRGCSFTILERSDELGGTWRDNTYPGVAVDIPSASYCFSYETDFGWSSKFAPGTQIQEYARHCADRYGVRKHIRFASEVVRARFDAASDSWHTELQDGTSIQSRFLISATGLFGAAKIPDFPGLKTFGGFVMHSGQWDHRHDLAGKRVAVIGTGASAVQLVPEIATRVAELKVFQRTPIWVAPRLDGKLNPESRWSPRRSAVVRRALRSISEMNLEALTFLIVNYRITRPLVRVIENAIRAWMRRQVRDPKTAESLVPAYGLGCKRPATSNSYLQTFNRDNVSLVTQPIVRMERAGIVTNDGELHAADTIVMATGFLTTEKGNAPNFPVTGSAGDELSEVWEAGRLQAYAGVSMPGFPNFFLTFGPYAGGFNWFAMLEANLRHIGDCIAVAQARRVTRVEVSGEAHERYMRHIWKRADGTVFKHPSCAQANSYYIDRHGDASLPLPHTPWWRVMRATVRGTRDYQFGGIA